MEASKLHFTGAMFNYFKSEISDTLVSKLNLDEPSWIGPGLNSPPTQPSTPVKQNGLLPNHLKIGNSGPADWGPNEDEEAQQQTDNTSQNSVISGGSGVTDSGLCSASQNSEGVSPLPQVGLVEEEAESQTLSNSIVACDNSETVNGISLNNAEEDSVEDAFSKSDDSGGSAEESNSGFVSRRSSSPPDLDLDVSAVCKPEENSNGPGDSSFAPNADVWGGTGDDDFGDFSAFDPPPPLTLGDSPPINVGDSPASDLSPEEEVKEDAFQFKEDLQLELESVQLENIVAAEEDGDRTLPVKNSDFGNTNEIADIEGTYIPARTHVEETLRTGVDEAPTEKTESPGPVAIAPDDEDDFADFESAQPLPEPQPKDSAHSFADFSNVGSTGDSGSQWPTPVQERRLSALSDDDAFGDFASDTVQPSSFTCQDVRQRLPEVLSEMFPPVQQLEESVVSDESSRTDELRLNLEDSGTWQSLRDFESTPALSFHWPGSHANRCLLAALNIDSRNVVSMKILRNSVVTEQTSSAVSDTVL